MAPTWRKRLASWINGPAEERAFAQLTSEIGATSSAPMVPASTVRIPTGTGERRQIVEVHTRAGLAGGPAVLDTSKPASVHRAPREKRAPRGGQRDFEAARTGRQNADWLAPSTAANMEIRKSIPVLRNRARAMVRNNGHAENALNTLTANLVGEGIRPRSATGKRNVDKKVNALWDEWAKTADPFHGLDIYGVQALAVRAWLESGEVLIRRRIRRMDDGLAVPLQVEVIEADQLDHTRIAALETGGKIVQGVEFDPINRRAAYWLLPFHPGDQLLSVAAFSIPGWTSKAIPASDVIHLFKPSRPGQVRGIPWLAPVLQDIHDLDDYSYAERVRKRIEACMVAFVIGNTPNDLSPDEDGIAPSVEDAEGNPIEEFTPGMVALVRDGKEVRVHAPSASPDYANFKKTELMEIAAGLGITYEQLTGDLSNVTFASYRVGRVELFRKIRGLHKTILVPKLCSTMWSWFIEIAVASGKLPIRADNYPCKWQEPRFESIERDKDAIADKANLRNGTDDLFNIIASWGRDPMEVLEQIAEVNAILDRLGLVLDIDPRKVTAAGSGPTPAGNDAGDGTKAGDGTAEGAAGGKPDTPSTDTKGDSTTGEA